MNTEKFLAAYNASRNGVNEYYFNRHYPLFNYSDGVKECAEAGCYWLLDILGTELHQHMKQHDLTFCVLVAHVSNGQGVIQGECDDETPATFTKAVHITDLPDGEWKFYITFDASINKSHCILPSEY
jgi:hypothetical protein